MKDTVIHVVNSVMVGINLFGNSLVCFVVLKHKSMRTTMNFLLVNLACSDMMVGVFSIFRIFIDIPFENLDGTAADAVCKLLTGGALMRVGILASVLFLVLIAVERYYAVLYPLQHQTGLLVRKVKPIVLFIWIYAFAWHIPIITLLEYSIEEKVCIISWPSYVRQAMSVWWVISTAVIPVIMMGYLYMQILRELWKRRLPGRVGSPKVRRKVTRMTLVISVIYILTWIPHSVIFLYFIFKPHRSSTASSSVDEFAIVLVSFNSCVNPIVYTLHSKPFSESLKSLLICKRNAVLPAVSVVAPQHVEEGEEVSSYENEYSVENNIDNRCQSIDGSHQGSFNGLP
ncbi:galanin receptor 2a-like [Montipora foliosa]|uniref:galanin receptor 2a-like n=1 Tax=Montipora foliosa TaxID=591990 RepID=UPI0035F18C00